MVPANDNAAPPAPPAPASLMVPIVGVIVDGGRVLFHRRPPPLFPNDWREA